MKLIDSAAWVNCVLTDFLPTSSVNCREGVLTVPTIIMDLSVSRCGFIRFCLEYSEALLLGAHTGRIIMSS